MGWIWEELQKGVEVNMIKIRCTPTENSQRITKILLKVKNRYLSSGSIHISQDVLEQQHQLGKKYSYKGAQGFCFIPT